jgi:hypothetical protein
MRTLLFLIYEQLSDDHSGYRPVKGKCYATGNNIRIETKLYAMNIQFF